MSERSESNESNGCAYITVPCMFCGEPCSALADIGAGACEPCHERACQIADEQTESCFEALK